MITAKQIQDEIYKTVDVIVREIIKSLPYCYIEEGTILEKNKDDSYKVRINDDISNIKKFDKDNTRFYQINDVVKILVENNNVSKKSIICRKD